MLNDLNDDTFLDLPELSKLPQILDLSKSLQYTYIVQKHTIDYDICMDIIFGGSPVNSHTWLSTFNINKSQVKLPTFNMNKLLNLNIDRKHKTNIVYDNMKRSKIIKRYNKEHYQFVLDRWSNKKPKLKYRKRIRYLCRKIYADKRPRHKGKFTKI